MEGTHMARIAGVSAREGGLGVRIAFFFTRRGMSQQTGREPERMLDPVEMYAHAPELLRAYGSMEKATAKMNRMDDRSMALATLKAATLVGCPFCLDIGSQISRRRGISDEELLALNAHHESPLFTDRDRLVMDYAVGMSSTPAHVSDELFAELRHHFDEGQIVELTHSIAFLNMRGRFGRGLGIEAAGFCEGGACAMPAAMADSS